MSPNLEGTVRKSQTTALGARKSQTTTLGESRLWRRAAWLVAALVAGTAAMARQQITDDEGSASALLSDSYPGLMRPRDVTTVALPTAVTVRHVQVAVGDHVRSGQPIIDLDDGEARRVVSQLTLEAE